MYVRKTRGNDNNYAGLDQECKAVTIRGSYNEEVT